MEVLGFDIGSNSVGSAWINTATGKITTGTSIFPAGVDESDEKRGDPKNAKRRMTRRTRITLARRAQRKRLLRQALIEAGLLPESEADFKALLDATDPWELRRKGLDDALSPFEFGRVLLHLAQRRGALGLKLNDSDDEDDDGAADDGRVRSSIRDVRRRMEERSPRPRTFGEFIAMIRGERVTPIATEDRRPDGKRKGPRLYRGAVRNKAGQYEHCADRTMIRDEFSALWEKQRGFKGETGKLLTDDLRLVLDDESGDSIWRHKGLLFGQRRQTWDLGTLGRCVLERSERCAPHADMYASRYLVVETVNNLKIVERGKEARPLTPDERRKILDYLSGPLGVEKPRKKRGDSTPPAERPKRSVSVTDLRNLMGSSKDGWGRATKTSRFRFTIESDENRQINTDWFSREIIHGSITAAKWATMPESLREGFNRALLRFDPDQDGDAEMLKAGVMGWGGLNETQAQALIEAWKLRPRLDSKRLNMSRRAVRNLLVYMDRDEPFQGRWLTQIEARKCIAEDADFLDVTTGQPLDKRARERYATGAKGSTARDRYYMRKHVLMKDGKPLIGPDGSPLREPPPAPLISNPVVRKAIHEVRRHLVEYLTTFDRKPDAVYIELAREARMGKVDADRLLFRNRLRNRIRRDILDEFNLHGLTSSQQRTAVDRVVLCVQQDGVCPLCGNQVVKESITPRMAAEGVECEVAHIIPRACGGHNGLSNIVLAHRKCNRDMDRRTPRQFWSEGKGFDEGIACIERIYGDVQRPKPSEVRSAAGNSLWACYFTGRDDKAKIEQFKKEVTDIQDMTARQEAATKYAARQVMAYLADALYDGKGLPERGGERRIYATDGLWTSRFRREWGLFFDPHGKNEHGLAKEEEQQRREKNRGDHRHHAIDAVITALCDRSLQIAWEERERDADKAGTNTADEAEMEAYRRTNPLAPPAPFSTREEFREAVKSAVFGANGRERPLCHRPVKRKLIGALHEETLFGPVLDGEGKLTSNYTGRKSVLDLTPNHLRVPEGWDELSAQLEGASLSKSKHRQIRKQLAAMLDPPPGKSGIVRDRALRDRIRKCLRAEGLDPDSFSKTQIKKLCPQDDPGAWKVRQASGVPIRSVALLRTMTDPVIVSRHEFDHATGKRRKLYHAHSGNGKATAARAYVGGNNHHIEIRAAVDQKGREVWTGSIVSAHEAAQRKLAKLEAFRREGIPRPSQFQELSDEERSRLSPILCLIEQAHPIVDRRDDDDKGGRFIMSLCEGELLYMRHKQTGQVGYFVVAKLDKPNRVVVVPHWDARPATERKDSDGNKIPNSSREQFTLVPGDLRALAPSDHPYAVKLRVTPLGRRKVLERD